MDVMPVQRQQVKPGAVFRFKTADRRVTELSEDIGSGFNVSWEYADGQPRRGRLTGTQWVYGFMAAALEEIPDPARSNEHRQLLPHGTLVSCTADPVAITLTTRCPAKWAMVDMETGDIWGHDGKTFRRLSEAEIKNVAQVAAQAVRTA